jgi:hypothetical protein
MEPRRGDYYIQMFYYIWPTRAPRNVPSRLRKTPGDHHIQMFYYIGAVC